MNIDRLDPSHNIKGVLMPPTSLRALPKFPTPDREQLQAAAELERSFTQQSGTLPGTYTDFKDVKALIGVHDRLWDTLESELLKYDNLAICKLLYQKLEIIVGHLQKLKYEAAAEQISTGRTQGPEKRFEIWRTVTPTTEGIKFLLEMATKCCKDQGLTSGASSLDFLISLSARTVMLDAHLTFLYHRIIPYEIIIAPDLGIHGGIKSEANAAIDDFERYKKNQMAQAEKDFVDQQKKVFIDKITGQEVKLDDFRTFPEFVNLDQAMTDELGYGMFDYLDYAEGCVRLFGERDYLKIVSVPRLTKQLKQMVGLNREKVESLLRDHALSQATVEALTRKEMMPFERYRRDSRLLRRPLLEVSHRGMTFAIIGIETFIIGTQIFYDCARYGALQMPSVQPGGRVKSAMGVLSAKIGDDFRDSIASKCIEMGFKAEKEWPLPQNKTHESVGPIDILVIDEKNRRFVLVEAKDLQSEGIVPNEMKGQRDRFLGTEEQGDKGYVRVLQDKEQAFTSNKEWQFCQLKHKLKVDGLENYTVEGVIVVFRPLFWPLFTTEPLPIVDDLEFYKRLQSGQRFFTTPIVI
ncbi:hypothetical protein MUP77_22060 [Candidatus Bathyarchaeota archaeon]|nr:hypothetical protein [Candidatus Bathyarchaeota archaeon]